MVSQGLGRPFADKTAVCINFKFILRVVINDFSLVQKSPVIIIKFKFPYIAYGRTGNLGEGKLLSLLGCESIGSLWLW